MARALPGDHQPQGELRHQLIGPGDHLLGLIRGRSAMPCTMSPRYPTTLFQSTQTSSPVSKNRDPSSPRDGEAMTVDGEHYRPSDHLRYPSARPSLASSLSKTGEYIADVQPDSGGPAFRATFKEHFSGQFRNAGIHRPDVGEQARVAFDPRSHKVEFDSAALRADEKASKHASDASFDALASGAPGTTPSASDRNKDADDSFEASPADMARKPEAGLLHSRGVRQRDAGPRRSLVTRSATLRFAARAVAERVRWVGLAVLDLASPWG